MQYSIQERLYEGKSAKRKRASKPKLYTDEISSGRAKVGDVIYLPGQPNDLATVSKLPNSYSANRYGIEISRFHNGKLQQTECSARGFVLKTN